MCIYINIVSVTFGIILNILLCCFFFIVDIFLYQYIECDLNTVYIFLCQMCLHLQLRLII